MQVENTEPSSVSVVSKYLAIRAKINSPETKNSLNNSRQHIQSNALASITEIGETDLMCNVN